MKRIFYICIIAALALCGCGAEEAPEASETPDSTAMITESSTDISYETSAVSVSESTPEPETTAINITELNTDSLQQLMGEDKWEMFGQYIPILRNESGFTISQLSVFYGEKEEYFSNLSDFSDMDGDVTISKLTLSDIDRDGTDELILCIDSMGGDYLILRAENGGYIGARFLYRGFQWLTPEGKYKASGGAAYEDYLYLTYETGQFVEHLSAYTAYNSKKGQQEYFIGENEVNAEEFAQFRGDWSDDCELWYYPLITGSWKYGYFF